MRLDSSIHVGFPEAWQVYHCEWMEFVPDCVVVDDGVPEFVHLIPLFFGLVGRCRHGAKRVVINTGKKFIMIDPISDDDNTQESEIYKIREEV